MLKSLLMGMTFLMLLACNSDHRPVIDIQLIIHPFGGGATGYMVSVHGDSIISTENRLGIHDNEFILTDEIEKRSRTLSKKERSELQILLSKLDKTIVHDADQNFWEDSWIFVLYIDGQELARYDDMMLRDKPETGKGDIAKQLIQYLMEIKLLEMKLGSFA